MVAKLSPAGNEEWLSSYDALGFRVVLDLAVTDDAQVVIAATVQESDEDGGSDILVARFDSTTGDVVSAHAVDVCAFEENSCDERGARAVIDRDGSVYAATEAPLTPPEGEAASSTSYVTIKIDPDGAPAWGHRLDWEPGRFPEFQQFPCSDGRIVQTPAQLALSDDDKILVAGRLGCWIGELGTYFYQQFRPPIPSVVLTRRWTTWAAWSTSTASSAKRKTQRATA